MVNEEHLALLRQGVEAWNQWRQEPSNRDVKLDLHGADLRGADLSKINFSRVDLSKANLSGVNLSEANLRGVNLSGVNLRGANLNGTDLSRVDLIGADLCGVTLSRTDLSWANLSRVDLSGVDLSWKSLTGADLRQANLSGANLRRADLRQAILKGAIFKQADLSGADFSGVDLSEVDLSGADLSEVDLSEVDLSGADLSGVDLSGADLSGVDLSEIDLSGANLSGVDLRRKKLNGANLSRANLIGVYLSGMDLHETDLHKANLNNADLSGAYLSEANLSGANLSGANLSEANLSGANFRRADLSEASLAIAQALGTDFTGSILTGACIEDWHINSGTNLEEVICEYIYLKANQQERRPSDPNKMFAAGEFTKLFQKALETVDLIFSNGVDWNAFAHSFRKLQVENETADLAIVSLENKGDGTVVVRVATSSTADKPSIDQQFWQGYEFAKRELIPQYETQISRHETQINQLFFSLNKSNQLLGEATRRMAEKPTYDLSNAKFASGFATEGGTVIGGTFNDFSNAQNLTDAAAQIQTLLTQLEQTGLPTETAQQQAAEDLAAQAKEDPTTLGKLVMWGQSLGDAAAKTTVSEAAKAVVKLALQLAGVPLP